MRSSKTTYVFAIMSVLFLALSCKPRYPACKKDGHCREGEFCVNGVCQQCREDGDCDDGMTCMSGVCRPPHSSSHPSSDLRQADLPEAASIRILTF